MTNATNSKTGRDGKLPWIKNKAFIFDTIIEFIEIKFWIFRHFKCNDDWSLKIRREKRFKPKFCHSVDKNSAVFTVSFISTSDPSFFMKLLQSFIKGNNDMGWWSETPLRCRFHILPLLIKIETEGVGITLASFQNIFSDQSETHPWYAFQTFVR